MHVRDDDAIQTVAAGDIVEVTKNEAPTQKEIDDVIAKVEKSLQEAYEKKKPAWETRPLIIK